MQEEVDQKTIALAVKTGKLTGQVLQAAMKKFLAARQKGKAKPHHGHQSLRQLKKDGSALSNIEITDANIGLFKPCAKKYDIDYTLRKDSSTHPPRYIEPGSKVEFEGRDVLAMDTAELSAYRGTDVGMIFQDPMTSLDPVFKVGYQMVENLLAHRDMTRKEAWDISVEALRSVGIPQPEARMEAYPFELSGGMCQRVIIAMALCCNAKLIIADEPTTALDVTVQAQVLDLLKDLQRKTGMALLLITHNLGVVWKMCDRVMVMYAGKVVESAATEELYQNPLHPYTWGLWDAMPSLALTAKQELKTIPGTPPDLRLTGRCCNLYNRCPYAQKICTEKVPELKEVAPEHFVACHFQTDGEKLERGTL